MTEQQKKKFHSTLCENRNFEAVEVVANPQTVEKDSTLCENRNFEAVEMMFSSLPAFYSTLCENRNFEADRNIKLF